jgi:hypothetical protein
VLSVALALAAPSAASAMQHPAAATAVSVGVVAHTAAHRARPAEARVAIILRRRPPLRKSGK